MVMIELEKDLAVFLDQETGPVEQVAREMIVLELYRRGTISSGKAAELLHVPLVDFIKRSSALGIPFIDMTQEEWDREMCLVDAV